MGNRHQDTAQKIVMAFKDSLGDELCRQISDEQFNVLELMISEGIGKELSDATEQVAEVVRQLRASVDKPELGM